MNTKCIGLFALLFLLPLLGNAQLTYPTVLANELDQTPIGLSARKIVVLIHGATGKTSADLPPGYNRYLDANGASELYYLYNMLRLKLVESDWKFLAYRWEKDASTGGILDNYLGPVNATQAAENASSHGTHLADSLTNAAPDLRQVHLIAHSAGSWVARQAAERLLQGNPYVVVQVTLLDPFIPDAVNGISSPLSTAAMSQLSGVTGNERIFTMENYYAIDPPTDEIGSVGGRATSQTFVWGQSGVNLQVEWGVIPGLPAYIHYWFHSGPIEFYADSMAGIVPQFIDALRVIGPPYDSSQVGWYRSLFMNQFGLPRILTHPKTPLPTAQGDTATLQVVASRASSYLWFRNGVSTGVTTPFINLLATSANEGDYVVRVKNNAGMVFSERARFAIATAASRPTIASVSPPSLTGLPLPQTRRITILGSRFTSSSALVFNNGVQNFNSDPARLTYISSTEIKYDIAVGPNAANWTVSQTAHWHTGFFAKKLNENATITHCVASATSSAQERDCSCPIRLTTRDATAGDAHGERSFLMPAVEVRQVRAPLVPTTNAWTSSARIAASPRRRRRTFSPRAPLASAAVSPSPWTCCPRWCPRLRRRPCRSPRRSRSSADGWAAAGWCGSSAAVEWAKCMRRCRNRSTARLP
jgi:pimeloyl-ACP methyl ester carboxylesterase